MTTAPSLLVPEHPRPYVAVWEITLACNCSCVHCGSSAGAARPDELSTAEALDLVGQLADLGCRSITLSGGEPLLRADWVDLAGAVRHRGLRLELITNGLVVADQADLIADAGFFGVSFSIDGPEEVHDRTRQLKGSLARLLDGAAALKERGVRIGAVTHINRYNTAHLEEIHALIVKHRFDGWQVQLTVPHGRAAQHYALCPTPADLPAIEDQIVELVRKDALFIQAADTIGWMSSSEPLLRSGSGKSVWGSCQAGLRAIGITSDGTIRGCLSMPTHFDEGNVRDRALSEIWNDPEGFSYNRRFDPATLDNECGTCAFGHICRGGCTSLAWLATGTTTSNPYCLRLCSDTEA